MAEWEALVMNQCFEAFMKAPQLWPLAEFSSPNSTEWRWKAESCIRHGSKYALWAIGEQDIKKLNQRPLWDWEKTPLWICLPSNCYTLEHEREIGWQLYLQQVRGVSFDQAVARKIPESVCTRCRILDAQDLHRADLTCPPRLLWRHHMVAMYPQAASFHRRRGQPSQNWAEEALNAIWEVYEEDRKEFEESEGKLAFCMIPKSGFMSFWGMFASLNGGVDPQRFPHIYPNVSSEDALRPGSGWRLAAFLRDPLERLLSAFLDKCTVNSVSIVSHGDCLDTGGAWCPGPSKLKLFPPRHRFEKVRAFEEYVLAGLPNAETDPHFRRQSRILTEDCGFPRRLHFLGRLGGGRNSVHRQVVELLQGTGGVPLRRARAHAGRHFPSSGDSPTARKLAPHHRGASRLLRDFYRRRKTRDAALRLLRKEYELLGLPVPHWATHGWEPDDGQ